MQTLKLNSRSTQQFSDIDKEIKEHIIVTFR